MNTEKKLKKWTEWERIIGFNNQNDVFVRTNGKKVQVKFLTAKVRGEACCCKDDNFDENFGIQLAYFRCLNKAREKQKIELERMLNMVNHDIAENNTIIKKMINSLE